MSISSHWLTVAIKGNATAVKKNLKQKEKKVSTFYMSLDNFLSNYLD